jgi:DNA-binding CsgD family transcriptional regulator
VLEGSPQAALQLAGAATALREEARLPPIPGARLQPLLDAAAPLGQHVVSRLWAEGMRKTPANAVALALEGQETGGPSGAQLDVVQARAGGLTPREREIVALLAAGLSNKAIAERLFISPATVARHVANILPKLGFSSRSQVAAWAVSQLPPNSALTDSPS